MVGGGRERMNLITLDDECHSLLADRFLRR